MKSLPSIPGGRQRVDDGRMLDAACEVFAGEGFGGAKMATIAARAGTTKPTLYAHFGSKEGLHAAAVEREYERLKARLFAAYEQDDGAPFRVRLARWTDAYFDFVRERPHGFRLISEGERHPAAAAVIKRTREDIVERIARLIADVSGRRTQESARLVGAMISGITWRCAERAVDAGVDLEEAARLCESFLGPALRGLDLELMESIDRRKRRSRR